MVFTASTSIAQYLESEEVALSVVAWRRPRRVRHLPSFLSPPPDFLLVTELRIPSSVFVAVFSYISLLGSQCQHKVGMDWARLINGAALIDERSVDFTAKR